MTEILTANGLENASMSTDVIKARIMTVMRNLPPMPQVTQKLLAVMRDEDSSANDVTRKARHFPAANSKCSR